MRLLWITPASKALGSAKSAPKATPESAQISAKASIWPLTTWLAQTKTLMASTMPTSQLRAKPMRLTTANHSGIDSAAHKK